eukprot:1328587-Pleurochrysis_carterae.AAC.1
MRATERILRVRDAAFAAPRKQRRAVRTLRTRFSAEALPDAPQCSGVRAVQFLRSMFIASPRRTCRRQSRQILVPDYIARYGSLYLT